MQGTMGELGLVVEEPLDRKSIWAFWSPPAGHECDFGLLALQNEPIDPRL